jgi:hypothetical protein
VAEEEEEESPKKGNLGEKRSKNINKQRLHVQNTKVAIYIKVVVSRADNKKVWTPVAFLLRFKIFFAVFYPSIAHTTINIIGHQAKNLALNFVAFVYIRHMFYFAIFFLSWRRNILVGVVVDVVLGKEEV